MTSYWFYKMATVALQIYFRFLIWLRLTFRKVQCYRHTKFRPHISIRGRYITTSGFWKRTATILKFYFRFRFWPFHCHRHVILHWPTKFYANQMIANRIMTSYWFYKMAGIASQIYFRFLIWLRLTFRKVQSYWHTKFLPDISIHDCDITTSGFDFDLFTAIGMWFSIGTPDFIEIGSSVAEVWRHSDFSKWLPSAMLDLV